MSIHSTVLLEGHTHDFLQELKVGDEKGRDSKVQLLLGPVNQLFPSSKAPLGRDATPSSSMDYAQPDYGKESLANYLASPIRTLCESVKDFEQEFISDHDIAEAYNLLCGRIRSRKSDISIMKIPGSMCNFDKNVPLLVLCISRDIHRVLPNPFESFSRRGEQPANQSYDTDPINEENMPPAMNHMLCQSALRLMSDLFMYPTLYSMFSQGQISTLLQDALLLCMPPASWAFDIERLRCTVLLMLKMQKLPLNLLRPDLTSVLNALLCVSNIREVTMTKIDGLAAICSLLQKYPTLLPQFVPLLPSILKDLKLDDLDVRFASVQALSSFALAKYNQLNAPLPASTFHQIAEAVHFHVTEEHAKSLPPDNLLPLVVKSAISDDSRSFWKKRGPTFAISLVSTLAILLDYRIFASPRSLKLVFSVIQAMAGSRWKRTAVHSEMWKILLWSFSRIPRSDEDLKNPMAQGKDVKGWNDIREKAYHLLKQEFREGIGVTFVTILLHSEVGCRRNHEDVGKALGIIGDLVKSERRTERTEAVLVLERLMSGIGAPLHGVEGENLDVRFSKELFDGSLLGHTFRDLTIRPTAAPISNIQPLSEAEALLFWDTLSGFWSSSVQDFLLHSDDNLPYNVFEIWQALLLVQGQLTESHQHLTASPSFTFRVVSIVTQITLPLETPEVQARYLYTISELWTVMKNVFTKSWLPSPAERILASLLKKQFDLSKEAVKIRWSQLCAELISVGIPTLLHVLHTKTLSPSQEEMEVTRRLWAVLVTNATKGKDVPEDHWMNLVQLLVMPIGAWEIEDSEAEIWKNTLSRTVEAGASVSQPSHVVISVVLDCLGESKLDLLKNVPTLLNSMISHLISAHCTNSTFKLLSVIDSVLQTSYPCIIAERKTWTLECLRLIAKLISQAVDSEIMQIITVMPNGLCKWIADEDSVLADFEHREVVVTIYGASLKRLSAIEPTLDCLRVLANFLYSAFVRVQTEGLLSFENFWRSTYHHFKSVSKKDYPLAIRACLKAWGDVCDDSFADDISLGSESQSLKSYTIPDSQPSPEKGEDNAPFNTFVLGPGLDVSDNENSQGTVTPKAKQILALPPLAVTSNNPISDSSALLALQTYQSNLASDVHVSENSFPDPSATKSDLKRQSDFNVPRAPKKRRTEPHFSSQCPGQPSSSDGLRARAPVSEPVTRVSSLSPLPLASNSQPSAGHSRKRRREETPSWLGSDLKRQRGTMPSSDDYDAWEQNVLNGISEVIEHPNDDLSDADETTEPTPGDLLSPSITQFPLRSRKRDRSQTAPEPSTAPDPEFVSIPQAGQTLRRHQTSPLEGMRRRTPAQLDALQRAYAIITDTGTSQIDVQDIMHARRLANQINQVLDEQMCLKFGAQQTDDAI